MSWGFFAPWGSLLLFFFQNVKKCYLNLRPKRRLAPINSMFSRSKKQGMKKMSLVSRSAELADSHSSSSESECGDNTYDNDVDDSTDLGNYTDYSDSSLSITPPRPQTSHALPPPPSQTRINANKSKQQPAPLTTSNTHNKAPNKMPYKNSMSVEMSNFDRSGVFLPPSPPPRKMVRPHTVAMVGKKKNYINLEIYDISKKRFQQWKGKNTFFLGGKVMAGPHFKQFTCTLSMIQVSWVIFATLIFPELPQINVEVDVDFDLPPQALLAVIAALLFTLMVTSLFLTAFSDPGIIPHRAPSSLVER